MADFQASPVQFIEYDTSVGAVAYDFESEDSAAPSVQLTYFQGETLPKIEIWKLFPGAAAGFVGVVRVRGRDSAGNVGDYSLDVTVEITGPPPPVNPRIVDL